MSLTAICTAILFFMTLISTSECKVNTTQFRENQGLYFDKLANMNLIKDEWKIVVFYEMKPYWQGTEALKAYTTSLEQICSHIHEQCNSVLLQLRHGITELEYYNQLFLTNQFRERGHRQRVRRGLINAIGNIAGDLFGVLDERFAQQYKRDIGLIQANQKHIASLWKNQTSLIEAENNLLKRAEIAMNQQHKLLNQHIVALEKATNVLKEDVQRNMVLNNFAIGAIIASNMMNNLRTMQNTLLDTITDIYHGRISLHLLTPTQISDELSTISSQLSKDVALPIDNVHSDLSKIYDLLTVKTRMLEDYVMFEIRLPLISRDKFEIFKIVPIPKYQDGNMITLVLVSDYISINIRKDSYITMTENDIKQCLVLSTTYFCHSRKPEYQMKEGDNLCQMGTSGCKTIIEPCSNYWIESNAINTYLYFCCNVCNVRTICTEAMTAHQLKGAGLINIGQGCLLRTDQLTIYPYKVHSSEIKILLDLYAPTIAPINDVINITLPQWPLGNQSHNYQTNLYQETEQLENRIHTLMQEDQVLAEVEDVSYHDIHHYVMIYVIVGIIAITGVIFAIRKVRCRWQIPQAAVGGESSTTPPLPSNMRRIATTRRHDQSEKIEMQAS
uniref:Envelope fusion protein n=1 Tax=Heliothis virescens TaxID=7102 RepID=A0A2A4IWQ1_HELVI